MLNGARQSGKTTLVKRIAELRNMHYVTLDEPDKLALAKTDPKNFLSFYGKKPLVIDEIQFAPELIPYLKIASDETHEKGRFLLTGSADFMRMHTITESLAGRMVRYTLYPLSNAEIHDKPHNAIDLLFEEDLAQFTTYSDLDGVIKSILRGGYPEIITMKQSLRNDWFDAYITSRIQKDLLELKTISLSKLHYIAELLKLMASYDASLLNYDAIAKKIKIDNKTVVSYIALLEAMYIVRRIRPFHLNTALRVVKSPKIHFLDTGLLSYLLGIDYESLFLRKDSDFGNVIENFVYTELLKEASYASEDVSLYHFRDLKKREVDLVLEHRDGRIVAIEVKAKATITQKELKGLTTLAQASKERFYRGYIFYGGEEIVPVSSEGYLFYCIPLGVLG